FAPSPTASGAAGSTASTAAGLGATGFGFCVSTTMAPGEASSMVLITLGFGTSNELDGTAGFFVGGTTIDSGDPASAIAFGGVTPIPGCVETAVLATGVVAGGTPAAGFTI